MASIFNEDSPMKTLHKSPATTHKLITNKLITDKSSAQSSASQMANRSGSQVKLWNAKQNWNRSLDDAVRIATRSHVHATSRRGCKMSVEWTSCIKEIASLRSNAVNDVKFSNFFEFRLYARESRDCHLLKVFAHKLLLS